MEKMPTVTIKEATTTACVTLVPAAAEAAEVEDDLFRLNEDMREAKN